MPKEDSEIDITAIEEKILKSGPRSKLMEAVMSISLSSLGISYYYAN
ncbi:hypothetical protein [Sulfolobus acidocaldarius]|nr:hypothetical protein [Sulfolobus acidocaldarius]